MIIRLQRKRRHYSPPAGKRPELGHIRGCGRTSRDSAVMGFKECTVRFHVQITPGHFQPVITGVGIPRGFHGDGFLFPTSGRQGEIAPLNLLFRGAGISGDDVRFAILDAFPSCKD